MHRLPHMIFQAFFLFISVEEMPLLQNGARNEAEAIKGKFTCQHDVMSIHCWSSKVIRIYVAKYTRTQNNVCSRNNHGLNSAEYCAPVDKTSLARGLCDGLVTCNISVDVETMGDHCPAVFKYLNVLYACKTPPPTMEPPYEQNKSTMVLTKPTTPSPSNKPTESVVSLSSIEEDEDTDEDEEHYSSGDVGFILYGGACSHTNSGTLFILVMSLAILL